jgi:hypothetical protein
MTNNRIVPTVELEPVNEQYYDQFKSGWQLQTKTEITNNTGRDVVVITRSGLRFTFSSKRAMPDRAILFREEFDLDARGDVILNPTDMPFNAEGSTAERMVNHVRSTMPLGNGPLVKRKSARAWHRLSIDALMDAGGSAYIQELDIVVTLQTNSNAIYHPFSMDGVMTAMKALEFDSVSLRIAIYIVDNCGSRTDRYINWQGRVMRVPCKARVGYKDGVYVVHPRPSHVGGVDTEYVSYHMTLEQAEEQYGLYKSPEEAQTHGFSKEALERENLKLKREAALRSYEREETAEQRKERLRFESEDASFRKIKQEERAAFRRDILDAGKWMLGIVSVCASISTAVIKLKGSSSK